MRRHKWTSLHFKGSETNKVGRQEGKGGILLCVCITVHGGLSKFASNMGN